MKNKNIRKPKDIIFGHIDIFWEQFAESRDKPKMKICLYDFIQFGYNGDSIAECRKLAKWLLKAADYVEQKSSNIIVK